jgi:hypothetical protein
MQISDPGLVSLAVLTNLRTLHIGNTRVSDAGQDDPKKALPRPEIRH